MKDKTFDFMTAVNFMNEGKKVRRKKYHNLPPMWIHGSYVYDGNDYEDPKFTIEDFISDDWEIVE
jgi:hypothetical protein